MKNLFPVLLVETIDIRPRWLIQQILIYPSRTCCLIETRKFMAFVDPR